jgi:hypothetical protein
MKLLLEITGEYGWTHSGVESWGGKWHVKACTVALEEIRKRLASMVNLKELETFSKQDIKSSLNIEGAKGKDSTSLKIGSGHDKSDEEREHVVNENNFLIDVSDVNIKPNTDYSKGKDERSTGGVRSWNASATMQYRVRIFGKE